MVSRTLIRYFGMRFLGAVLSVFFGIFVLVVLVDYIEMMRRAGDVPNVSAWMVAKTSFFRVPQLTERLLPFSVLVGAMACYLALSRRNELVVARAAGMSAWQFVAPGADRRVRDRARWRPRSTIRCRPRCASGRRGSKPRCSATRPLDAAEHAAASGCASAAPTANRSSMRHRARNRACGSTASASSPSTLPASALERIEAKTRRPGTRPLAARGGARLRHRRAAARPRNLSGQDQPDRRAGPRKLFHPRNRAVLGPSCVYRNRRTIRAGRRRL